MCQSMMSFRPRRARRGRIVVAGYGGVGAHGFEEPEGGVDGVVFGRLAGIGEAVGQHALSVWRAKCAGSPARFRAAGDEGQAGQGDHGVAAPVGEPVIAGDDRHHSPRATRNWSAAA